MAPKRWVANTSPLTLLGKADNLDLLGVRVDVVVVPRAVVNEINAKSDGRSILQVLTESPSFRVVDDEAVSLEILSWDLGAGEIHVIANAQLHGAIDRLSTTWKRDASPDQWATRSSGRSES